jgi:hypothetical protein
MRLYRASSVAGGTKAPPFHPKVAQSALSGGSRRVLGFIAAMTVSVGMGVSVEAASMPPSPFNVDGGVSDYALIDGAILDATARGGSFGLVAETSSGSGSGLRTLSTVPFVTIAGATYFEFNLDIREPSGNRSFALDMIELLIDGDVFWSFDTSIIFNLPGAVATASPTAAGRDARLLIPTLLIQAAANVHEKVYTGSSTLTFNWSQSQSQGNPDRWSVAEGCPSAPPAGYDCFGAADIVGDPNIVPLPAAAPLLGAAIAGLVWVRRRRPSVALRRA